MFMYIANMLQIFTPIIIILQNWISHTPPEIKHSHGKSPVDT